MQTTRRWWSGGWGGRWRSGGWGGGWVGEGGGEEGRIYCSMNW